MEPTDNQNRDKSWSNNRNLLRLLEQERRRRQVAPEEKDPFLAKTPLFAKPYKTDKEDELSRRIKNLLGNVDSKMLLSHESSLIPIWIPKKPKIKSQTQSHRPASSKTNPYEDIRKESSRESLGLPPNPEPSRDDSDKGHSNQRSEAKAPQSKILPEPVKPIVHMYEQSIEGILEEMSSPLSPLLPPFRTPARTETSEFPLQAKVTLPILARASGKLQEISLLSRTSVLAEGACLEASLSSLTINSVES
ncbi:AF4/FMR2 family member 4-like isoform X1 [Anomalospiza imberbis]|uniref:AF4/FMR2 family member 4-like isoform X1 n=1 Tax=Anomalospiza imberbis TaxID=187417 RepID=UPI00358E7305